MLMMKRTCRCLEAKDIWKLSVLSTYFCDESKPSLRKRAYYFFGQKAFKQFYYLMASVTF